MEKPKDVFCLDCGKLLEQVIPGVIVGGWLRTGWYGKEEGSVCNQCHDKGQLKKEG